MRGFSSRGDNFMPWGSAGSDHPHACGENILTFRPRSTELGPSPRVWGERSDQYRWIRTHRTIPTRVGRTPRSSKPESVAPDHPHACGENVTAVLVLLVDVGPSPRVWGERYRCAGVVGRCRTIPTRVGRTSGAPARAGLRPDHPHACGENKQSPNAGAHRTGPSPRVWGELFAIIPHPLSQRTIPTRVGRT